MSLRTTRHPKRYDGQVAVVTGASSGIGRAIATTLAGRGATVVGLARRRGLLDELGAELARASSKSTTEVCDVADADALAAALERLERQHGRIDVLVNNAGVDIMLPVPGGDRDTVRRVFDVNFFSVVTGTLAVVPGMVRRGSGAVVNVSSDTARAPEPRQGAYAASKAAVSTFSDSVAHEVARHGVHVHVLYPGWVPTAMALADADAAGGSMPPRLVRRTADGVAALVAERIGGTRVDINAAKLPLVAPVARTIAPVSYARAMRRMGTTGDAGSEAGD